MNYVSIIKFLFNPDKRFLQQKLDDHRKQSAILTIVIATTGTSLWLWDYVTDPIGAMNTIWLRAAIPVFAIPCVAVLLLKVNIRWIPAVAFIAALGCEAVFLEILNRLNNGMTYGLAGFMYFFFMGIILMETLSLRLNLTYTLCVAVLPHIIAWAGFAPNFQHIQYSALVWPAVNMVMVVQVIMAVNHWRRQDYQSRLAIQEEALQKTNDGLELRVQERTEELETANQLLRQEVIERTKAEELLHKREQALQESERRYRFLFEESIDGVFLISREGQILDISKTGVRMFGYDSKEEMLSLDLTRDLYLNPEERNEPMRVVEDKALYEHETLFKKKNGEKMLARCVISKAEGACDGTAIYQGVIRDVTRQKNLEQELFKAKKLEIVGQLAGGVAHEVRNPLNALLSISEALFLEKDIAENSEYKPYIHHIRTQVGRLSKLMTDLLELGKPIKAKNIHPTSLYQILTDTVNLWTTTDLTRLKKLTFTCDQQTPELLVTVDPTRLQQALLNLLDNASQHSIKNGPISLHIGAPVERRITISIRDAGKGIPPAKLDKVFDPFYTSRTGGTGLGLPLVKHIIESMGGTVKLFNNEPLPGCTAELELMIERRSKERP